jgi:hypothetical protein
MSAAAVANTLSVALKERMVLMSDNLDTKKEIDEFYKNAMKELAEEKKKNKKDVVKSDVKPKKPVKKNLDENGEEKPKRPLTKYNIFLKEMQPKIKELYPDLSSTERLTKIGEEWQKQKNNADPTDHVADADPDAEEDVAEVPAPEPVVDAPEPKVVAKPKKVKESKKVTIILDEVTPPNSEEEAEPVVEPVTEPVIQSVAEPVVKMNVCGRAGMPKKAVRKSIVKKEVAANV